MQVATLARVHLSLGRGCDKQSDDRKPMGFTDENDETVLPCSCKKSGSSQDYDPADTTLQRADPNLGVKLRNES